MSKKNASKNYKKNIKTKIKKNLDHRKPKKHFLKV